MDDKIAEVTGTGYDPKGEFHVDGQKADLQKVPGLTTVLWVRVLNNDAVLEPLSDGGSNAYRMIGDPTEGAMLVAAVKAWLAC